MKQLRFTFQCFMTQNTDTCSITKRRNAAPIYNATKTSEGLIILGWDFFVSPVNALLVMINFRKQTWRHGPSPTQVDISTHLFAHVNTAGHDGFDCQLMNSRIIFTPDGRFKQSFGTAVSCRVYGHFP